MAECISLARAGRRSRGWIFTGTWVGSQTCSRRKARGSKRRKQAGRSGRFTQEAREIPQDPHKQEPLDFLTLCYNGQRYRVDSLCAIFPHARMTLRQCSQSSRAAKLPRTEAPLHWLVALHVLCCLLTCGMDGPTCAARAVALRGGAHALRAGATSLEPNDNEEIDAPPSVRDCAFCWHIVARHVERLSPGHCSFRMCSLPVVRISWLWLSADICPCGLRSTHVCHTRLVSCHSLRRCLHLARFLTDSFVLPPCAHRLRQQLSYDPFWRAQIASMWKIPT